jgi:RND superfamily putative drug exporter
MHLLISLAVLLALASCAAFLSPTFNDRMQLPQSAQSNVGFTAMQRHFATSALLPQYIYIHSPRDLRTPQALADLEQMAQRVSQLPDIATVRGVTRPNRSIRPKSAIKPGGWAPTWRTPRHRSPAGATTSTH